MPFRLQTSEPVPDDIKRIVREQIENATAALQSDDQEQGIHDARKSFKRIRAVVRLVRSDLGDEHYRSENSSFRDMGRKLSLVRDSAALIETLDMLRDLSHDYIKARSFSAIHAAFMRYRQTMIEDIDVEQQVADVLEELQAAHCRVADWPLYTDSFAALAAGLKKIYRQGRKLFPLAYSAPTNEHFHEWRKTVKYHWYHIRLLEPAWPGMLESYRQELKTLSDYLGDDHDLAVLGDLLHQPPDSLDRRAAMPALLELVQQQQTSLRRQARPLGQRIFALKPGQFARAMEQFYAAWQVDAGRWTGDDGS